MSVVVSVVVIMMIIGYCVSCLPFHPRQSLPFHPRQSLPCQVLPLDNLLQLMADLLLPQIKRSLPAVKLSLELAQLHLEAPEGGDLE
jgi:hypothetical protein